MKIMKLTRRFPRYLFSFSYHKITLFEKKYVIKLSKYFNFNVPFKASCELADSFKIMMQMYKLLLELTLFRSFLYHGKIL